MRELLTRSLKLRATGVTLPYGRTIANLHADQHESTGRLAVYRGLLDGLDHRHAVHDAAERRVLAVERRRVSRSR